MDSHRREEIRNELRRLAESQAEQVNSLERMLTLVNEEFSLDPFTYFRRTTSPPTGAITTAHFRIDPTLLSVTFRGKTCFLGNSYPFKVLLHLAHNRNTYVTHEAIFEAVWDGVRSDEALRSTVKMLRKKLREFGLPQLAKAIDGSAYGHYALKLAL